MAVLLHSMISIRRRCTQTHALPVWVLLASPERTNPHLQVSGGACRTIVLMTLHDMLFPANQLV